MGSTAQKSTVLPDAAVEDVLREVAVARERFAAIVALLRAADPDGQQVSRAEQVVLSIQRLEWELNPQTRKTPFQEPAVLAR